MSARMRVLRSAAVPAAVAQASCLHTGQDAGAETGRKSL